MKIFFTIFILTFACNAAFSQNWHSAYEMLKAPPTAGRTQVSMGYNNRFDTVKCVYKLIGSDVLLRGYKYVFILEGFYIDTPNTVNVFFDDRKRRINQVEKYYFN